MLRCPYLRQLIPEYSKDNSQDTSTSRNIIMACPWLSIQQPTPEFVKDRQPNRGTAPALVYDGNALE